MRCSEFLPTMVASYLEFRGWIHQDTRCNGMSVAVLLRQCAGRTNCRLSGTPALATRRWSSKAIWMRLGWLSGNIHWVLLVWGWFCVSKTIIPDAQEHFLTPSARRDIHLFGGLGLRW